MILNQATDIKLGTSQVKKVMQGTTQVWPVIKKYRLGDTTDYNPYELHPYSFVIASGHYHQGIGGRPWYWTYDVTLNDMTTTTVRSDDNSEYFKLPDDTLVLKLGTVVSDTAPFFNEEGEKLYITNDNKLTFTPTSIEAKVYYLFSDGTKGKWKASEESTTPFIGYEKNGVYYSVSGFNSLIEEK